MLKCVLLYEQVSFVGRMTERGFSESSESFLTCVMGSQGCESTPSVQQHQGGQANRVAKNQKEAGGKASRGDQGPRSARDRTKQWGYIPLSVEILSLQI